MSEQPTPADPSPRIVACLSCHGSGRVRHLNWFRLTWHLDGPGRVVACRACHGRGMVTV